MDDYENSIIRLGQLVRQARTEHSLSVRELAKQIDIHHSSISRLESGQIVRPTPGFLKGLARALDLELSDLYHLAGHTLPEDLPDFEVYLRTKHVHVPEAAVAELRGYYDYLSSPSTASMLTVLRPVRTKRKPPELVHQQTRSA